MKPQLIFGKCREIRLAPRRTFGFKSDASPKSTHLGEEFAAVGNLRTQGTSSAERTSSSSVCSADSTSAVCALISRRFHSSVKRSRKYPRWRPEIVSRSPASSSFSTA